jgi:1-acyl-sn-glycerol-3-phosphate acyltransferase
MTSRGRLAKWWYSLARFVCWLFCKVWFRYRYCGQRYVPTSGPLLVVSNHQSHLDPVLLGVASPRQLCALARKTLFFWPLSWLIRSFGAVPIDLSGTGVAGIKAILKLLRDGEAVIVFPEGTRTRDGNLQPLQSGFVAIARRASAAIVPAAIHGAFAALPRGKVVPRPRPITLAFGPAISVSEVATLSDDELTQLVRERISALLAEQTEGGE